MLYILRGKVHVMKQIKYSIDIQGAYKLIQAAEEKAKELNFSISTTIVDESGVSKAFSRMDGAALVSVGASRKKALTAVGFGMATGDDWYNFIKDDPILLHGAQHISEFMLLGGGAPIKDSDGNIMGAIGVSGGHYKMDEACVNAALAAIKAA